MTLSLQGKVAAITGAASGIGRALALELARHGCHLALSDVNAQGLAQTAQLLQASGVRVHTTVLDVAQREAVFAWADTVAANFGAVHLVFNNAGVALGAMAETVSERDFRWIMDINFWGVVWGTQAFLPHLRRAGQGHVVNISSLFGLLSVPTQGCYNASKFAVRGYTEALRQELDLEQCGVSATCVHPGGVRTNIAHAARLDAGMAHLSGGNPETARSRFDLLLRTPAPRAAQRILRAVQRNERRVVVGADAHLLDWVVRLLASGYQPLITALVRLGLRPR